MLDRRPPLERVETTPRTVELPPDALDDERPALIVYTLRNDRHCRRAPSATPGRGENLDALAERLGVTAADRLTHGLPLFHVHGLVLGLLGPRAAGASSSTSAASSRGRWLTRSRPRPTMVSGFATCITGLRSRPRRTAAWRARAGPATATRVRSAPLPAPDFERIEELTGQKIVERYGLTETLMNTAVHASGERRPGYGGEPLPGIEIRLVGDTAPTSRSPTTRPRRGRDPRPEPVAGYLDRPDATLRRCATAGSSRRHGRARPRRLL